MPSSPSHSIILWFSEENGVAFQFSSSSECTKDDWIVWIFVFNVAFRRFCGQHTLPVKPYFYVARDFIENQSSLPPWSINMDACIQLREVTISCSTEIPHQVVRVLTKYNTAYPFQLMTIKLYHLWPQIIWPFVFNPISAIYYNALNYYLHLYITRSL